MEKEDANKPMEKGGENDCSQGPVQKRGCTDIICCGVFIAHWVLFFGLMIWAFTSGNPARLTAQRDFKGAYCGFKGNFEPWNDVKDGRRYDMEGRKKLANTMNVHSMIEQYAGSIICPQVSLLQAAGNLPAITSSDYNAACGASAAIAGASASVSQFSDPSQAASKLMGGSPSPIEQIAKYFHNVCVTDCDKVSAFGLKSGTGGGLTANQYRLYRYHPPPSHRLYKVTEAMWNYYIDSGNTAMDSILGFKALPEADCPEDPMYCVPYPGLEYNDVANYCIFKLGPDAAAAAGAAAGAAGDAMKGGVAEAAGGDLGKTFGDLSIAWPTFVIMFFISLAVGFAFMVLLRFMVGIMVWGSIGVVFALLAGGGGYFYSQTLCTTESQDVTGTNVATDTTTTTTVAPTNGTNSSRLLMELDDSSSVLIRQLSGNTNTTTTTSTLTYEKCTEPDKSAREQSEFLAYVLFAFAGLYALIILCMASRIMLGVAVNKVAATFMYQTKSILFVPVAQIGVSAIYWLIWLIVALHVLSSVDSEGNAFVPVAPTGPFSQEKAEGTFFTPGECTANYPPGSSFYDEYTAYTYVGGDPSAKRLAVANTQCTYSAGTQEKDVPCYRCTLPRMEIATIQFAFTFFSLLWNNAFIIAVGQCTVAGAVGIWYFTPNDQKGSKPAVKPAFTNCFRYHPGSLAFGAFILAVVQFIKYCLRYLQKQAEQQKNYVLAKIAMALQCCIQCFERFIKFLNKNAYIQIALLGKNFCRSAWAAFCLILRNAARIGILGMIGGMVSMIGMVFITGFTTVIGYFILMAMYGDKDCTGEDCKVSSPILCVMMYVMMGYMIGKLFMTVFGLAVDTTLQCFCADEELNKDKGNFAANNYTPEELKGFLKDPNAKRGCCG